MKIIIEHKDKRFEIIPHSEAENVAYLILKESVYNIQIGHLIEYPELNDSLELMKILDNMIDELNNAVKLKNEGKPLPSRFAHTIEPIETVKI